jgi:DNA-binding MarR family transcriptional regulator
MICRSIEVAMTGEEGSIEALSRDAYLATFVASRLFTDGVEAVCQARQVSMAQYTVLWVLCLSETTDGLPVGAIADGLLTRSSDVSRLIDRMERAELVTRSASPSDRRSVLISPTSKAREIFEALSIEITALHCQQWSGLDATELAELARLLNKAMWQGPTSPRSPNP